MKGAIMPRKSSKGRKATPLATSETQRRQAARKVSADQVKPQAGLDRHKRADVRPPKFPGRLGGR